MLGMAGGTRSASSPQEAHTLVTKWEQPIDHSKVMSYVPGNAGTWWEESSSRELQELSWEPGKLSQGTQAGGKQRKGRRNCKDLLGLRAGSD